MAVQNEYGALQASPHPFSEVLKVRGARCGLFLPVNFEWYSNYTAICKSNYELILGNPLYRQKLDGSLPADYFDNPRILTAQKPPTPVMQKASSAAQLL